MTEISKKLASVINAAQKKLINENQIMPVKVEGGILVGNVVIVNEGTVKHLFKHEELIYKDVYLNKVAIRLANLLARNIRNVTMDKLYSEDQDYGKWYLDSQMLVAQYHKALHTKDHDKADVLWAKYLESKGKALQAKSRAESLASI
jgi:hypothetical protein